MIETISPITFTNNTITPTKTLPNFANFLTNTVNQTNTNLLAADKALEQLASGQAASLHQTMLTLEEAKISLQFLEQIRNRLLNSWQDILKEQI
jgi:flagellar hook-basal body complex protein FliE